MRQLRRDTFTLLVLWLAATVAALQVRADEPAAPSADQASESDTFVAGDDISTHGDINGASVLAGGRIESGAHVHGNAILFGGDIRVTGEARESLYAVGGDIDIESRIGNDVRVAGGQVTIGPQADIAGDVTIAAGHIRIEGPVAGDIRLAGGQIRLDGPVGGNVRVRAGQLEIGPNARIAGRVQFETKEPPHIDSAAQVKGGMQAERRAWYSRWVGSRSNVGGPRWFALLVVGSIMILASPALGARFLEDLRKRTGATIGWGLISFIATPVALVLCAITIIGLPLALALLLAFLLLLLLGSASGMIALGQWGLARIAPAHASSAGFQILALLATLIVVSLLRHLPLIGWLVGFAVLVLGIGVLLLELSRRMHTDSKAAGA